ncbi:MAG TPA: DsrE/DsrF/DrsH-like family protein [Thermomicrobiaceae bacterium]|nr:DsrE/DsrF/DrsH-like family protein [Thermomicrobiaceae bacterium]
MDDKPDKMAIIVFSGTVDKLMAVSTLSTGAVAMGMEVNLFVTNWGLIAFRKGDYQQNMKISKDFEEFREPMMAAMQAKKVPSWFDTLTQAKELGELHVFACSQTMELLDIKQTDLEDIIDDTLGVAGFIDKSRDAKFTLFI